MGFYILIHRLFPGGGGAWNQLTTKGGGWFLTNGHILNTVILGQISVQHQRQVLFCRAQDNSLFIPLAGRSWMWIQAVRFMVEKDQHTYPLPRWRGPFS